MLSRCHISWVVAATAAATLLASCSARGTPAEQQAVESAKAVFDSMAIARSGRVTGSSFEVDAATFTVKAQRVEELGVPRTFRREDRVIPGEIAAFTTDDPMIAGWVCIVSVFRRNEHELSITISCGERVTDHVFGTPLPPATTSRG